MKDIIDILIGQTSFDRGRELRHEFSGHGSLLTDAPGESIGDFGEKCIVAVQLVADDVGDIGSGGKVDKWAFKDRENTHLATPAVF